MQYAYDPSSVAGLVPSMPVNSMSDINLNWLRAIEYNGVRHYDVNLGKSLGCFNVNVYSSRLALMIAYPRYDFSSFSNNMSFTQIYPSAYYKGK